MPGRQDSRCRDNAGMPGQQTHVVLNKAPYCNTDVDNVDAITRKTSLTTMQTDSLRHVVLFI